MEVKMNSIDVSPQAAAKRSGAGTVAMKLEGVNLPVADVDRTKGRRCPGGRARLASVAAHLIEPQAVN
jgi:hypothetical protein